MRRGGLAIFLATGLAMAGCTVHPPGESAERAAAQRAGQALVASADVPALPADPTPDDLVRHALLASPALAQKYWEWRSAIEQIPQDGTQPTNLALSGSTSITRGRLSTDTTSLGAGNDPMTDILLPAKLSAAARRALENARAAGLRFRKAQFELRGKVLSSYAEYALLAELIRLETSNEALLKTTVMVVEARGRVGMSDQQDLLRSRNELDLASNDLANLRSQIPGQRAALNALIGRPVDAPIPLPARIPESAAVEPDDTHALTEASARNPELQAVAREIAARQQNIALAKLEYLPDFSVSASTDLGGIAQSLAGSVTIPLLRHEAIDAAVAQAEANLRATESAGRQSQLDLGASVIMDLSIIRDADRQVSFLEHSVLPRARQAVTVGRAAYEAGRASLLDLLDEQRTVITLSRLAARLHTTREQRLADLESLTAGRWWEPPIVPESQTQTATQSRDQRGF